MASLRAAFSKWWAHVAILVPALAVAAALRGLALSRVPGWYSDEGTALALARSFLTQHHWDYLGVRDGMLMAARLPLFPWLLTVLSHFHPLDMTLARGAAVFLSLLTIALFYIWIWLNSHDRGWAAASVWIYAGLGWWVLYQRMAFSYHLGAALIMGGAIALTRYFEKASRWWGAAAAVLIGLAACTDLAFWPFLLAFFLLVLWHRPKDTLWMMVSGLLPLGVMLGALAVRSPWMLHDLTSLLWNTSQSLVPQLVLLILNFSVIGNVYLWWTLSQIGWLLAPRSRRIWGTALVFWGIPWLFMARTRFMGGFGLYYQIPYWPYHAAGLGALLRYGLPWATQRLQHLLKGLFTRSPLDRVPAGLQHQIALWGSALLLFALLLAGLTYEGAQAIEVLQGNFAGHIALALTPTHDAQQTIIYMREHTQENDLVVASPALAWAMPGHATDFQITLAAMGKTTPFFPAGISRTRWLYELRYPHAQYAVIDPIWRNWGVKTPSIRQMTVEIQTHWVPVAVFGAVTIYRNPNQPSR